MTRKLKTTNIKGKEYVEVKERVLAFKEDYTNGSIRTELVSTADASRVVIKATVIPDVKNPDRYFNGYSQARWDDVTSMVNKTSALENAETSAVGRALGMMGIGVIDGIASADEMHKATSTVVPPAVKKAEQEAQPEMATPGQIKFIQSLQDQGKVDTSVNPFKLTKLQAGKVISDGKDAPAMPTKTLEQ